MGIGDRGLAIQASAPRAESDSRLPNPCSPIFTRLRRLHRQLQRIEHAAGVAAGNVDEVVERVVVEHDIELAVAPFGIGRAPARTMARRCSWVSGCKLKDAAAADQRFVDLEVGVFGGGADEDDRAVLDPGQQRILLGLVEAVYLVDKEDGALAVVLGPFLGLGHCAANLLDAGEHGVQGDEVGACVVLAMTRAKRGLAGAGRAVEDEAAQLIGLDGAAQQTARPDDVLLADKLVQRARPHARGQRRFVLEPFLVGVVE